MSTLRDSIWDIISDYENDDFNSVEALEKIMEKVDKEKSPTVDEVRSREIALSMIVTLVEEIKKGSSIVSEIDIETITDLAYNIRYDTRWRIMKIRYRRV